MKPARNQTMKSRRCSCLFVVAAVLVASAEIASAALARTVRSSSGPVLSVASGRTDATYRQGEPVTFTIHLLQ